MDVHLRIDVAKVGLRGGLRDDERVRDMLRGAAACQQYEDLLLAPRQLVLVGERMARVLQLVRVGKRIVNVGCVRAGPLTADWRVVVGDASRKRRDGSAGEQYDKRDDRAGHEYVGRHMLQ